MPVFQRPPRNSAWLEGSLSPSQAGQFRQAVADLASIYKRHIQIEDELGFPIAGRVLSQADHREKNVGSHRHPPIGLDKVSD